jgi:hypothetical protein
MYNNIAIGTLKTGYPVYKLKIRQATNCTTVRCHVSLSFGSRFLVEVGSGAATCSLAPDTASQKMWAPELPCTPRPRTPPPSRGELRCCHVPLSSGPCLPAREGSGATTWLRTLDSASPVVSFGAATCPTALSRL